MNLKTKTAAARSAPCWPLSPPPQRSPRRRRSSTCAEPASARTRSMTQGSARLSGAVTGVPFDGTYTATLASIGREPARRPETCEPATATLDVTGPKNRSLHLAATGEVCGTWADATYVVTHSSSGATS